MASAKNPHSIRVDIRYMEFLLNSLKETRDIANGKYRNERGERLHRMKLIDKGIRQLTLIIQAHKREYGI